MKGREESKPGPTSRRIPSELLQQHGVQLYLFRTGSFATPAIHEFSAPGDVGQQHDAVPREFPNFVR